MSAPVAHQGRRESRDAPGSRDPATELGLALRVPLLSAATLALGVAAHLLAGGAPPSAGLTVVLGLLVALGWRAVSRTELLLPRLVLTLAAMQAALHVALAENACTPPSAPAVLGATDSTDALGPATPHVAGRLADLAGPQIGHQLAQPSVGMWLAHAFAGLAVAVWLRRGEAATWRAVRRLLPRLSFPTPLPDAVPAPLPAIAAEVRPPVPAVVLLVDRRRGPPLPVG